MYPNRTDLTASSFGKVAIKAGAEAACSSEDMVRHMHETPLLLDGVPLPPSLQN